MNIDWTTWLVVWAICAGIGAFICQSKNRSPWEGAVLGGLLGILGIIITLFLKKELPSAPTGMVAVKCPRCNAIQNVAQDQGQFTCWQCHQSNHVPTRAAKPEAEPRSRDVRCEICQAQQTIPFNANKWFTCKQCRQLSRLL